MCPWGDAIGSTLLRVVIVADVVWWQAFSLVFVSEIGDKTFFIAGTSLPTIRHAHLPCSTQLSPIMEGHRNSRPCMCLTLIKRKGASSRRVDSPLCVNRFAGDEDVSPDLLHWLHGGTHRHDRHLRRHRTGRWAPPRHLHRHPLDGPVGSLPRAWCIWCVWCDIDLPRHPVVTGWGRQAGPVGGSAGLCLLRLQDPLCTTRRHSVTWPRCAGLTVLCPGGDAGRV